MAPECEIFILPEAEAQKLAEYSLSKEKDPDSVYQEYQLSLALLPLRFAKEGRFSHVLFAEGKDIITVQNRFRTLLAETTGIKIRPLFSKLLRLILVGCMAESGKSTFVEILHEKHKFNHTKLRYFAFQAELWTSVSENQYYCSIDPELEIIIQFDEYCNSHHYLDRFTIESVYGVELARRFKNALGDRVVVAFVDTSSQTRLARILGDENEFHNKDYRKL